MHEINRDFESLMNSLKSGGFSDIYSRVLSGKIYSDVAPDDIKSVDQQIAYVRFTS